MLLSILKDVAKHMYSDLSHISNQTIAGIGELKFSFTKNMLDLQKNNLPEYVLLAWMSIKNILS